MQTTFNKSYEQNLIPIMENLPQWAIGVLIFVAMTLFNLMQGFITKWVNSTETNDTTLSDKIDKLSGNINDLKMTIVRSTSAQETNTADIRDMKRQLEALKDKVSHNTAALNANK